MASQITSTMPGRIKRVLKTAIVVPFVALALTVLRPGLAGAQDPGQDRPMDVRGLLIFKIPLGKSESDKVTPELGFDFSVRDAYESPYKPEQFDSRTGAKLPEYDMESVRTWPLEDPQRVTKQPPGSEDARKPDQPAGPEPRIEGLARYGVPTLSIE